MESVVRLPSRHHRGRRPLYVRSRMTPRDRLSNDRGFSLASSVLGVVMAMVVILALAGVTNQVLNTSAMTFENTQRTNAARSVANKASITLAGPIAQANKAFSTTINGEVINGWKWTSGALAADGITLFVAVPKFNHGVDECVAIEVTKVDDGSCVVIQRVLRTDAAGVRVLELVPSTATPTQFTVAAVAGANKVRFYLPVKPTSASGTITITVTSNRGPSTTFAEPVPPGAGTVRAVGELITNGSAHTLTFTITGGTVVDPASAKFHRGRNA